MTFQLRILVTDRAIEIDGVPWKLQLSFVPEVQGHVVVWEWTDPRWRHTTSQIEGSWPSMKAHWMTTSECEWRLCKWLKKHMSCIISSCSEVTRKWRVCVASLGDRTEKEAATWFQTIMSKGCIFWVQAGRLDFRMQHQWATPACRYEVDDFEMDLESGIWMMSTENRWQTNGF